MAWSDDTDSGGWGGYGGNLGGDYDGGYGMGGEGLGGWSGGGLGLGSGPYSSIDEYGNFTGVVDESKNIVEKWATNFLTNISKKWSELSGFQKLGLGASAISSPMLALAGAVLLGGKSLAQALSTPGLTESDKTNLTQAVENYNTLPEQDKAQIKSEVESVAGPITSETATSTSASNSTGLPANIQTGMDKYVADSANITSDYKAKADSLWNDYLDFENTYFGKFQDVQNEYSSNLNSIPKMNLTLPSTMGGATLPMAPKVHSAMYSDQANTKGNLIGQQANTALSGMSSRNALNNNMFNVNQTGLTNSLLPTNTALDLYKMERASQLGLNNTLAAADANKPSTLSTWAPVAGALLSLNGNDGTNLSSAWDFISDRRS